MNDLICLHTPSISVVVPESSQSSVWRVLKELRAHEYTLVGHNWYCNRDDAEADREPTYIMISPSEE